MRLGLRRHSPSETRIRYRRRRNERLRSAARAGLPEHRQDDQRVLSRCRCYRALRASRWSIGTPPKHLLCRAIVVRNDGCSARDRRADRLTRRHLRFIQAAPRRRADRCHATRGSRAAQGEARAHTASWGPRALPATSAVCGCAPLRQHRSRAAHSKASRRWSPRDGRNKSGSAPRGARAAKVQRWERRFSVFRHVTRGGYDAILIRQNFVSRSQQTMPSVVNQSPLFLSSDRNASASSARSRPANSMDLEPTVTCAR